MYKYIAVQVAKLKDKGGREEVKDSKRDEGLRRLPDAEAISTERLRALEDGNGQEVGDRGGTR